MHWASWWTGVCGGVRGFRGAGAGWGRVRLSERFSTAVTRRSTERDRPLPIQSVRHQPVLIHIHIWVWTAHRPKNGKETCLHLNEHYGLYLQQYVYNLRVMCPIPRSSNVSDSVAPWVGQPCPGGTGESLGPGIDTVTSLIMSLVGPCVETLYVMCRTVCYRWGVVEDELSSDTSLLGADLGYQHLANNHTPHSSHQNGSIYKHTES